MTPKWVELIRRELARPEPEPTPESFYRGVWSRIREREARPLRAVESAPLASLGRMCWRSAPVFAGVLLVVSLWIWRHPPDQHSEIMSSSESYVLDAGEAPSDTSLLYQITHDEPVSESESK